MDRNTLLLLRHADAEPFGAAADHKRVLTARGIRQAQATWTWLCEHGMLPTAAVASSAVRVRQTLEHALGELAAQADLRDELFRADTDGWLAAIRRFAPDEERPLLCGHNPVMGELASYLTGRRLHFRTCELMALDCPPGWQEAGAGSCSLAEHWRPRA